MISEKYSKPNRKIEDNQNNNYPVIIMLLSFFTGLILFIPNVSGQDYTRWELPEGAKLRLGKGSIRDLAYSSDGKHLFVDSSIGIWTYDAQTGTALDLITKQPNERTKISPHDNIYASWNSDNILQVRRLTDGSVINSEGVDAEELRRLAFSPDKRTLAFCQKEDIYLWDFTTGEQKAILTGHTDWIGNIVFSPDGTTLVSADSNETIRLWDVHTAIYSTIFNSHDSDISKLLFSPDGKTLIIVDRDDHIRLWDVHTVTEKLVIDTPTYNCIAISPDGKTIANCKIDALSLWNTETGTHIGELRGHRYLLRAVAFSPDGSTLASGDGDALFLWDSTTGERKMSITEHTSYVRGMALSPDFSTLVTTNGENIHLWDPTTGKYKKMIFGGYRSFHQSLSISPDGNTLASQQSINTHIWDLECSTHKFAIPELRRNAKNNDRGSSSTAFSPDGRLLAGGSEYSTSVNLWYMGHTQKAVLNGHTRGITSVAFSSDSRFLVSGSNDHTVRLWDVESEAEIATFTGHSDEVFCVAFNPDASVIASGGLDRTIMLWDVATGEAKVIHTGHTDRINSVAFSRDGNTIVSSAYLQDPTVRLWDVTTGDMKTMLHGHTSGVSNVAFSSNGRTLATGSWDGTVLLWNFDVIMGTNDGTARQLAEDVNRDGTVDIQDLIDVSTQLIPKEYLLLPNYPNPFNPETWIPYQLAKSSNVTVHIYAVDGQLVRTLKLGNQHAGIYHSRTRAAHWDGKNEIGEPVANGIYYYSLSTEHFTATRRMVIRK